MKNNLFYLNLNNDNLSIEIDGVYYREKWKEIKGYFGYYISDFGRVKSGPKQKHPIDIIIRQYKNRYGYLNVFVYKDSRRKTFLVHRLVALHFIKNPKNKRTVQHIYHDKSNNFFLYLKWFTDSEQTQDAYDNNRIRKRVGKDHFASKPVIQYLDNKMVGRFESASLAQKHTGVSSVTIGLACKGLRKKSGGYKWEYDKKCL